MDPSPPDRKHDTLSIEVLDEDAQPAGDVGASPGKEVPAAPKKSKRPGPIQLAALALLMLLLVGGATWWALSRPSVGTGPASTPVTPSYLLKDAIALINSSTPITLSVPVSVEVHVGTLGDAPDSEGWTPALKEARRALDEGRYTAAISQYSALVAGGAGREASDALWGLAEAYDTSGQKELSARAYTLFAGQDDPRALDALYRVAALDEETGHGGEASRLYAEYAKHDGPARHVAMLSQARLLGANQAAEDMYNAVIADNPLDVDLRLALAALGDVKSKRGDHKGAAEVYGRLAALQAAQPRPLLDQVGLPAAVLSAKEVAQANDKAGALKALLDYIKDPCGGKSPACPSYPSGRYQALDALLKIDPLSVVSRTLSPMLAARVAYDAGYYAPAITYMGIVRSISPVPAEQPAASLLTGKAFELSGDAATAYNWYTATVQTYPTAPEAPEAIRKAGDMLEAQSEWDAAISVYRDALQRYPNAGRETALTRTHAGLLAYRLEARDEALDFLLPIQSMRELSPTIKAEAFFWAAKVEKSKGDPTWEKTLAAVSLLTPGTYFDFRARSLLASEPDGGPIIPTFAASGVTSGQLNSQFADEAQAREVLLSWATKFSPPSTTITSTLTSPLTRITGAATPTNPLLIPTQSSALSPQHFDEVQRAIVLTALGDDRAPVALRALAQSMRESGDGSNLAELTMFARYHASTSVTMRVAEQMALLDASGDPLKRPALLLRTIYPTPYGDLVAGEAQTRDLDPLAVYALARQESQFVPAARSRADARGLTQVIPSTGEGIAKQLGDTAYSTDDLFLPYVNIRYGTYYLASNLPAFDRKLLPTMAAYNGGPGNAARWLAGSALIDPDLYVERIDLFETEDYLGKVYTNYGFYRAAYGR